jgi:hypothetical protein
LKNGPTNSEKLLIFTQQTSLIEPKIYQHLFSVLYPNFKIGVEQAEIILKTKFISNKPLSFSDAFAGSFASHLQKQNFFSQGTLFTLSGPSYTGKNFRQTTFVPNESSLQMKNTNQPFPDYLYEFQKDSYKYFDLKTGDISPMSGNLFITSDLDTYNRVSRELFSTQNGLFLKAGLEYEVFSDEINRLMKNPTLSWVDRNIKLHEFYRQNITKLPAELNPSLIFHINPTCYLEEDKRLLNRINLNSDSHSDLKETEKHYQKLFIIVEL